MNCPATIKCPFCRLVDVRLRPGKAHCPKCEAGFEIDAGMEYAFVDLENPRMPLKGTFCQQCGLIQSGFRTHCPGCEAALISGLH